MNHQDISSFSMKTSKTNIEDPKTENTELIKPITNGFVTPITDIPRVRS